MIHGEYAEYVRESGIDSVTQYELWKAIRNAIEHYRIDEVLISTFAGERSRWLENDLIGRVREITDNPHMVVELECG